MVTVPPGAKPGQTIQVNTSTQAQGGAMVVTVPKAMGWRHRRGSRFDSGAHPLLLLARG